MYLTKNFRCIFEVTVIWYDKQIIFTDDLSFKAAASQSPIVPDPSYMFEASNAIDRNTATCMRTDAIGPNTFRKNTWWKVDLGGIYNIYSINILFKTYDNLGN